MNTNSNYDKYIFLLKKAGWYEERRVDLSKIYLKYKEKNLIPFEKAETFLSEFYGLSGSINFNYKNTLNKISTGNYFFHFGDILENDEYEIEEYKSILKVAKEECFYLGISGNYLPARVAIGKSGKLYFKHDYEDKVHIFNSLIESIKYEIGNKNIELE